jgi:hypothetical protein
MSLLIQERQLTADPSSGPISSSPHEWSLMFFGGEYAYSVLRTARPGDFRVQSDFGGEVVARDAGSALVAQTSGVLDAAPFDRSELTYARVDGCVVDKTLVLMELEVLEPGLFLAVGPYGADAFADAIVPAHADSLLRRRDGG